LGKQVYSNVHLFFVAQYASDAHLVAQHMRYIWRIACAAYGATPALLLQHYSATTGNAPAPTAK
jgi:hypothetical protein